jgi:hypothetical protein
VHEEGCVYARLGLGIVKNALRSASVLYFMSKNVKEIFQVRRHLEGSKEIHTQTSISRDKPTCLFGFHSIHLLEGPVTYTLVLHKARTIAACSRDTRTPVVKMEIC